MTYELHFHPLALREWKKLSKDIQTQFKKILSRRLEMPHVPNARLSATLHNCYKIKLRQAGFRLVYSVEDTQCKILVITVGKRNLVYETADQRLSSASV